MTTAAPSAPARSRDTFFLVSRRRLGGLELGPLAGVPRGPGSDLAGSRPYEPGDDVRAIDWAASARLSSASGSDEFVVRERFAELAPRVVVVADRRPAMALYAAPWVSKRAAADEAERLIGEAALRARGLVGRVVARADGLDWLPPTGNPSAWRARDYEGSGASHGAVEAGFEHLRRVRALPAGAFVFVVSDFLDPTRADVWLGAVRRGWDVVPVVVQDPTWEASFPTEVGGLTLPIVDPETGRTFLRRIGKEEAVERRGSNEHRLADLLARFAELGMDSVVLTSHAPDDVLRAFVVWADARKTPPGRAW